MLFQAFEQLCFLHPYALCLLLLLPTLLFARRRRFQHLKRAAGALGLAVDGAGKWFALTTLAYVLAFCLMVLALASPQALRERHTEVLRELDLVFLLDISPSMNAQDIFPSRLRKADEIIRGVILDTPGLNRFAMVAFSGSSVIFSYLTSDVGNIIFYLDYLSRQRVDHLGTRIALAIGSGLKVMDEGRASATGDSPNREVMILISDGEDHGLGLTSTLQTAQRRGIPIHTIGIGSEGGAFIPLEREDGAVEYLAGPQGARVVSRVKPATLMRIADVTGGSFFRVREGEDLGPALREILKLEREVVSFERRKDWIELYRPPMIAASLFLLLGLLLAQRQVRARGH